MAGEEIQSKQADATLAGMGPRTTYLSSKEIQRRWSERIKAQSLFSARTTVKSYLDMVRDKLAAVASRGEIPLVAEKGLQDALSNLGYTPEHGFPQDKHRYGGDRIPPATKGSITDLSSSRRIQLIIDTNVKQARSLGQIAASEDPVHLLASPAWELTRTGARKKPRGDWRARWKAAGDSVKWVGAVKNRLVALKTSPIWQAIADGVGGFRDTVGSPYPPFAFGSGLSWVNVGRSEWKRLCEAEGVPDGLETITEAARKLKAERAAGVQTQPEASSSGAFGDTTRSPLVEPPPPPFAPDYTRREEAVRRIDEARKAVDEAQKAVKKAMQDANAAAHEAEVLVAQWPEANVSPMLAQFAQYVKSVQTAYDETTASATRIEEAETERAAAKDPSDEAAQKAYDAAQERAAERSGQCSSSARQAARTAEMYASAAAKRVESVKTAVSAWKREECGRIKAAADERMKKTDAGQLKDLRAEIDAFEKSHGIKAKDRDLNNAIVKAWDTADTRASVRRSNVRTAYKALVSVCDAEDPRAAKSAQMEFEKQADACDKGYELLRTAIDAYKAEIVRLEDERRNSMESATDGENTNAEADAGALAAMPHDPGAFPAEITKNDIAGGAHVGGSTGAKLVTMPDGRKYICKQTNATKAGDGKITPAHLQNEMAGDAIYRAAGINVPDFQAYEIDGKPVKLSAFIPGAKSVGEYMRSATPKQKEALKRKLARGFLVDAVLANWDVVGQGEDNILVDANGEPWRIDNGSAMGFRARGVPKTDAEWKDSTFPDEWRTLRTSNSSVFGDLTAHDVFSQKIDWDAVIRATPAKDRPVVERRVKEVKEMQRRCASLDNARITPEESSRTLEASYDLVKSGLREFVPKVKVTGGYPDMGVFRPNSSAGRPVGLAPEDDAMQTIVDKITAAAISVNSHAVKDGKPNMTTVKAAIEAAKDLPKLKKSGIDTSAYEPFVELLKKAKSVGQTEKIPMVPAYSPQKKVNRKAQKYGSVSEWKADFIMRGGDPDAKPDYANYEFIVKAAKSQGGNSWLGSYSLDDDRKHPFTCIRKIIEFEMTGRNPDPDSGSANGESYGFTPAQKDAYRKAWKYYTDRKNAKEMERARKAVTLSRAFTQIEIENAGLPGYDPETNTILVARTESTDVKNLATDENGKPVKIGGFASFKSRGNGESTSLFRTVVVEGSHLMLQRVPIAAVSDTFMTNARSASGSYQSKYLGDGENEAHVDLAVVPEIYYAGKVNGGDDLQPYFDAFVKAEKKRNTGR